MATIEKFEEINAWIKTRELSKEMNTILNKNKKDQSLIWQIKKTIGSTMDNIAEGFERGGNKEFIQFLSIAKGSSAEFRLQLYRALDLNMISHQEFEKMYECATEISKMIYSLIQYLKSSDAKGYKYKK
jgi:four helix bundle protein